MRIIPQVRKIPLPGRIRIVPLPAQEESPLEEHHKTGQGPRDEPEETFTARQAKRREGQKPDPILSRSSERKKEEKEKGEHAGLGRSTALQPDCEPSRKSRSHTHEIPTRGF